MSESGFTYLKLLNPHPRDSLIVFKEEGHEYFVEGELCNKSDGWLSSTGWVHSPDFFDHFDPDTTITRMMRSKNWPNSKYYGMTREQIKNQWAAAGNKACRIGSLFHLGCPESFYNMQPMTDDGDISFLKTQFIKFVQEHQHLEPYRTEFFVFDNDLKLTGSIDMLFRDRDDKNVFYIYDWKISKEICTQRPQFAKRPKHGDLKAFWDCNYTHYSMQLGLYKYILNTNYGMNVTDLYLIRFYHNYEGYDKIPCLEMQDIIADLMEKRKMRLANWGKESDESKVGDPIDFSVCLL